MTILRHKGRQQGTRRGRGTVRHGPAEESELPVAVYEHDGSAFTRLSLINLPRQANYRHRIE